MTILEEKFTEHKIYFSILSVTFARNIIRYDKRFANCAPSALKYILCFDIKCFLFCAILTKIVFHQQIVV
jgi:hypothetical protein